MAKKLDKQLAKDKLNQCLKLSDSVTPSQQIEKFVGLSQSVGKTHIAFLGTALLAKILNPRVNLYYLKPSKIEHEQEKELAYSARSICHSILVPFARKNNINLGATGAEPLNNQPYFGMNTLNDGTGIHPTAKPAYEELLALINKIQKTSESETEELLAQFFRATKKVPQLATKMIKVGSQLTIPHLCQQLNSLLAEKSENGKRAQAFASGILDAFFNEYFIDVGSGRVNDPSRTRPGDITLKLAKTDSTVWVAVEVKHKPVSHQEIINFVEQATKSFTVKNFVYLSLHTDQEPLDTHRLAFEAHAFGSSLKVFMSIQEFISDILFWPHSNMTANAPTVVNHIYRRLEEIECEPITLRRFQQQLGSEV